MRRSPCGSYFYLCIQSDYAHAFVRESISTKVWKEEEDFRSRCIQPSAVSGAAFQILWGILFDAH